MFNKIFVLVLLFVLDCKAKTLISEIINRQTIEDGPFGGNQVINFTPMMVLRNNQSSFHVSGNGGSPWTDGGEVHLKGSKIFYLRLMSFCLRPCNQRHST